MEANVVIAPSSVVTNAVGVYPTKDIKKGEIVCFAESLVHGSWVQGHQARSAKPQNCAEVSMVRVFRQPQKMVLVGDQKRSVWPHFNSSYESCHAANMVAMVNTKEGGAVMDNKFCHFEALHDIGAFSAELLLDYPVDFRDDESAKKTTTSRGPCKQDDWLQDPSNTSFTHRDVGFAPLAWGTAIDLAFEAMGQRGHSPSPQGMAASTRALGHAQRASDKTKATGTWLVALGVSRNVLG